MSTPNPLIQSLPEQAASALTVAAIDAFGKTNAGKLAAAMTAQSVAAILQSAGSGDVSGAITQFQALLGAIKDPGLAMLAGNLFKVGAPFLQVEGQVIADTPLLGTSVAGWFTGTAAGMNAAAQAYITAYGVKPA